MHSQPDLPVDDIDEFYLGLKPIVGYSQLRGGIENRVFLLPKTALGDIILRWHSRAVDAVRFEAEFLRGLKGRVGPVAVPKLLESPQGERVMVHSSGVFTGYPLIPGARLDRQVSGPLVLSLTSFLEDLHVYGRKFLRSSNDPPARVPEVCADHRMAELLARSEVTVVHGDLTPDNVVVDPLSAQLIGVIDFDDIRAEHAIVDFALLVRGLFLIGMGVEQSTEVARLVFEHGQISEEYSIAEFLCIVEYVSVGMMRLLSSRDRSEPVLSALSRERDAYEMTVKILAAGV